MCMTKSEKHSSGISRITVSSIYESQPPGYYKYPITDWKSYLAAAKKRFDADFQKRWVQTKRLDDFIPLKTLGAGSYGRVILVRLRDSDNRFLAMKVVDKSRAAQEQEVEYLLNERRVLASLVFPFTVQLVHFFMDQVNLYFLMPFAQGGELFALIRKVGYFSEAQTRFYAAQVLLALEYMHFHELMHRDIKPENILLDGEGFVKVTDFGFTKRIKGRTYTICGTPEYMAPEILRNQGYSFSADWWALGVLLYEMSVGTTPFQAKNSTELHMLILRERYILPKFLSQSLRDLIKNILKVNITERLGCLKHGVVDLKKSLFFHEIGWLDMINRRIQPPIIPRIGGSSNHMGESPSHESIFELPTLYSPKTFDYESVTFKDF